MKYQFCPKCGGNLKEVLTDNQMRLQCSNCGFVFYQNSKPCVTVVIVEQNKVLLGKRAHEPLKGAWDLLGGFLEAGEHPEDGLRRELKEETGLELVTSHLLGIFMDKYPQFDYDTLNIAYLCQVKGEPMASDDAAELKWFPLNSLPKFAFKNAEETINTLKQYLKYGI